MVLNWNGWRDTVECLESLQRLDYPSFRIVVVDNGSSDDSCERIRRWASGDEPVESRHLLYRPDTKPLEVASYDEAEAEAGGTASGEDALLAAPPHGALTLIRSGENRGFAGGCNLGIRYALKRRADYVWLLNNDVVVESEALPEMVATANSDEKIGLVGSVLYDFDTPETIQAWGGGSINWWMGTTKNLKTLTEPGPDYLTGASLLIRAAVIESIGLLDESYFFYGEDMDYSRRALEAGWSIGVAEGSTVLHKEGGTISEAERAKSLTSDRLMIESTITFFGKHGGARWPLAVLVRVAGMTVNRLRRKQADRILPLLRVAGGACRGVVAGKVRRKPSPGSWRDPYQDNQ